MGSNSLAIHPLPSGTVDGGMRRVVGLAFIWGWSFVFIKVAVGGMTPFTVAAGRLMLGAATLLVISRQTGDRLPRDRMFWRNVAVAGVIGCAIPFTLLAWGEERITSALTSVAQGTTSMFTALFAAMFLKERLRPVQVLGLVGGLAGVAIAAGLGAGDLTGASIAGVVAAVAAGAFYGLTFVHNQRHLMGVPAIAAATGQLIVGAIVLAPFALVSSAVSGFHPTPSRIGAILGLGVLGTGVAYWLNYTAIARVGATGASLVTYLIPPIAVVVGWAVLGESIEANLVIGLVLIVVSVAAVRYQPRVRVTAQGGAQVRYTSQS
jgi:drug/metabolite transporter (DMT)-like permease